MEIEGVVEDIIFRNEDNGYTVADLDSGEVLNTIVGNFLSINVGENIVCRGDFKHSKYGLQFVVTSYESVAPKTEKGIIRYLSSGLIKGVGEKTAKAIVDRFKSNTLEVIEFNPDLLATVKGVSKKKAHLISMSLVEVKEMQNAMIFLQSYNISNNLALKIYEIYKNKTIELVKLNPYRLVEDVNGIGFLKADIIAKNMGISEKSPFRIRAGILHVLNEASDKNGHTYLLKYNLIESACKLLNLKIEEMENDFVEVCDILQKENLIKIFWQDKREIVMASKMYNAEKYVASKLAILKNCANGCQLNIDDDISLFEKLNNIKFHEDQKNAVKMAINDGVSVITGGPGTGKTTIISCVLEILKNQKNEVVLLAPTGRAAKRLSESTNEQAKTIHRALEIDFRSKLGIFVYNEKNPLPFDAVIVDEVSMVDITLMASLLKALKRGTKLILVGDKDQLPSVGAGNVLADILSSGVISVSQLTKIYRQQGDSLIISNAHLINQGEMPILDNNSKDFFFEKKDSNEETFKSIVSLMTERITRHFKIDVSKIQVLAPLKAGICGIENLNISLQEKINPPKANKHEIKVGQTIFREGDKVMQMSNNYELEWQKQSEKINVYEKGTGVFNGDIGYIHKISHETQEVVVWFEDGREAVYPRSELSQLSLAYAITIHKSQGSEFDAVIIPAIAGPSIIFTRNLIYTAVTRAKKIVLIVGDKNALKKMIKNTYMAKRFTLLSEFLIQENNKINQLFN